MGIQIRSGGTAQRVGLWLGALSFLLLLVFPVDPGNGPASRMAAVALLMAIWWISDCILNLR